MFLQIRPKILFRAALPLLMAMPTPVHSEPLRLAVTVPKESSIEDVALQLQCFSPTQAKIEPLFPFAGREEDLSALRKMFLVEYAATHYSTAPEAHELERRFKDACADKFTNIKLDLALDNSQADPSANALCGPEDQDDVPPNIDWSLDHSFFKSAWEMKPPDGGRQQGEGIRICHPDTGWADHLELADANLDQARSFDVLERRVGVAKDPLDTGLMVSTGHGTSTGSVIASGLDGALKGAAPKATLVPIRAIRFVGRVFDTDLARAVHYATEVADCDVISMSIGGVGFIGLEAAIDRAVNQGLIVVAAAGNCVPHVVAPARYANTISVAGIDIEDRAWENTARGDPKGGPAGSVDISAPARHVYRAVRRTPEEDDLAKVSHGSGTSYATANVAGAAALWLAFHNLSRHSHMQSPSLQEGFREALRGSARPPQPQSQWDPGLGAGILNAAELLLYPLPWEHQNEAMSTSGLIQRLSAATGIPAQAVWVRVEGILSSEEISVDEFFDRFGNEIEYWSYQDPSLVQNWFRRSGQPDPAANQRLLEDVVSSELGAILGRQAPPAPSH